MTTITELLQYLDTTARVSCPTITCERAAELAEVMRDLYGQHQVDIAEMVSWKIHAQILHERDEAQSYVRDLLAQREESIASTKLRIETIQRLEKERDEARESVRYHLRSVAIFRNERDGWQGRASAAEKERDEARRELAALRGKAVSDVEVDASVYERPGRVKP